MAKSDFYAGVIVGMEMALFGLAGYRMIAGPTTKYVVIAKVKVKVNVDQKVDV
jgi:hypothetical protein